MKAKRRTAALLAAALVLVIVSGCLFLLFCANHSCGHNRCAVCDTAVRFSARAFAVPGITVIAAAVSSAVLNAALYMNTANAGKNTPVALKVKLSS